MTHSAVAEYLLDRAKKRAAAEEGAGAGCGVAGVTVLTKPILQSLMASDRALCLHPLQVWQSALVRRRAVGFTIFATNKCSVRICFVSGAKVCVGAIYLGLF